MPSVSIIIPAYNEESRIQRAILQTKTAFDALSLSHEIIVVDDGSRDMTTRHTAGAKLIKHQQNQGKGAAVRTGMLAAEGEWALFMDADLSTAPEAFAAFIPLLHSTDVLFGSRRAFNARIAQRQPAWRDQSGQLFNVAVRLLTGLPYRDTQCGFKAFRMAACRPLFEAQKTNGWAFDVELLKRAQLANLRMQEIPVEWRHAEGSRVRLSHARTILIDLLNIRRTLGKT